MIIQTIPVGITQTNCYIVGCEEAQEGVIIDPGGHPQRILKAVDESGLSIRYVLNTHCHFDHVGGAAALKEQYGCKIVAHRLDAAYLEAGDSQVTAASWYGAKFQPLIIYHRIEGHKEIFKVGKQEVLAYHCPGHSPGSLVYLATLENQKILFGQDVHGPLDPSLLSNREDYIRSLKFMMGLKADILCEGHFGIYKGKDNINKFIQSFL